MAMAGGDTDANEFIVDDKIDEGKTVNNRILRFHSFVTVWRRHVDIF